MNKISRLSESLISKIAAGEVIERPAYAVKELIENSIDAQAKNISVVIKDYGMTEIKVIDDGVGISKDELNLAIQSNTTSKIRDEIDLEKISTMGFRGEALSSICSISDYEIKSNGYMISSDKKTPIKTPMPDGTQVIIKNIFSKTPVRKKFLSSKQTEYRHIVNQFQSIAIAYPDISFELLHNDKVINQINSGNLLERSKKLLGETLNKKSFEVKENDSYINLSGFISHPEVNFKNRNKMFIYLNGRRIYNNSLYKSILAGYRNLLMSNTYPFVLININIQKDLVDVNVHPRKEIVKFFDEARITTLLKDSVIKTLDENNLTFSNLSFSKKITTSDFANEIRDEVMQTKEGQLGKIKKSSDIIQIHNAYLITETENGFLILDQHAVHEAILYYKYKLSFDKRKKSGKKNKLKKPLLVTLNESQQIILDEYQQYLKKIGYEIEEFGNNTFRITSTPLYSINIDKRTAFFELLDELEEKSFKDIDEQSNQMLAYLACRSAIKTGNKLTKKEMKELLKFLDKIDLGYTCPHGRPVKIELSKKYLDAMFRRI